VYFKIYTTDNQNEILDRIRTLEAVSKEAPVSRESSEHKARGATRRDVWIATIGTLVGVIITAGANIAIAKLGDDSPKATFPTVPTAPPSVISIGEPRPGAQVPWCSTIRGSASIASDQALVVADLEENDDDIYFESAVTRQADGPGWSANLQLGEEKDPSSVGKNYTVYLLVMDKDLVKYLRDVTAKTHWSAKATTDLDALVSKKIEVPVSRSGRRGEC
jgi:hypothetical protein